MAIVSLLDVSLSFGGAPLLDKVNLQIDRGERVCLLGRNGAGKSTLMKVITGELNADVGQVFRQFGAVFSSLRQEVPAGLTGTVRTVVEGEGGAYEVHNDWERHDRVERLLEGMGLPVDHEFAALSAGQKRRVLLARGLVEEPQLLLLDEPLGALDLKLRERMKIELKQLQAAFGTTFVYITHDQSEALVLSDQVAVMNNGRFEQVGTPQELYYSPATPFVAGFVGANNRIDGRVSALHGESADVTTAEGWTVRAQRHDALAAGDAATAFVRPEVAVLGRSVEELAMPAESAVHQGVVESLLFDGANSAVLLRESRTRAEFRVALPQTGRFADLKVGETVMFSFAPERAVCFAAGARHG